MIRLGGITWLLTYHCNLACGHCFFDGSPGPYLDPALIDRVLADCPGLESMYFQHLSGGEVCLDQARLLDAIRRIRARFGGEIGLSTNGFWASDDAAADALVGRLAEAGATGIMVSSDWFHRPWLDPGYPRRAALAVRRHGLGGHSWYMGARLPEGAPQADVVNAESEALADGAALPPARAMMRGIGKGGRWLGPKQSEPPAGPCSELSHCLGERGPFNPAMVWIDPHGNVSICHGIVIGNAWTESFADIITRYEASGHPVTAALAAEGPRSLYRRAQAAGLPLPEAWHDECELCYSSRKALFEAGIDRATATATSGLGPQECYPS